ncbi:MAG: histidine kinase [Streptosporangiales bacterium]|nr:histidine kinase [Streptosporangiales bacterium]
MTRFGDGLAVGPDLLHAAESAVEQAVTSVHPAPPDLLCVFVSGDDPDHVESAGRHAAEVSGARTTLGCSASGVIGGNRGVEMTSAVSAWAAALPGVRITPFHLETVRGEEALIVTGIPERHDDDAVGVLLADPYTFPIDAFVERSNQVLGGLPLIGGIATGPRGEGSTRLFVEGRAVGNGAVGVLLGGPVAARTVVSQGCRPIGPPMVVTGADDNVLYELAGTPAVSKLEEIVSALPPTDQALAAEGLQIGIAIDEYAEQHERGDFLIRGVAGMDETSGALVVGDVVSVGRTVRFQVRDAATAEEDLTELLARFQEDGTFGPVEGALLFSCNGRGSNLFPSADHDVLAVRKGLQTTGIGGFFAAGEIGPVAGRNHIHGFTASILAFGRQREGADPS